jgi:hypothetical protein
MVTPFQAKTNFLTLKFFYPAALGAQKTARTASPSLGDVNVESLDPTSLTSLLPIITF